jgi:thymidylate synthase
MNILAIISGEYGIRHAENLRANGPKAWRVETWQAPSLLPPVIDYPEDYLPASLPPADLLVSFAEHKGVAELLPEIAQLCGAQAVIAPVDSEAWLPRGLARQLHGWLGRAGIACATPKPLCSLTETEYQVTRREKGTVDHPLIAEFARYFGRPAFDITLDPVTRRVTRARASRDAVCGCASYVAERLVGISADEAEQQAGMLHHHFPCLASMGIDADFGDTLMHVSGNILRDEIGEQVRPFKQVQYLVPGNRAGDPGVESSGPEPGPNFDQTGEA